MATGFQSNGTYIMSGGMGGVNRVSTGWYSPTLHQLHGIQSRGNFNNRSFQNHSFSNRGYTPSTYRPRGASASNALSRSTRVGMNIERNAGLYAGGVALGGAVAISLLKNRRRAAQTRKRAGGKPGAPQVSRAARQRAASHRRRNHGKFA